MINIENAANLPDIHTTLVFRPFAILDNQELAAALSLLGVVASGQSTTTVSCPGTPQETVPDSSLDSLPGLAPGTMKGPWLACSLDSDGTVRLWPPVHCP
jgi:hypothetical protein